MSAKDYKNATIIRAKHKDEYFRMQRKTAQDENLSFEARGMIAYLLSKPDDWEIQVHDLKQKCAKGRVYRILDELVENGYLEKRTKYRDDKGHWQWTPYRLHERPIDNIIPLTENAETDTPYPDFRDTEKPDTENAEIKEHNTDNKTPIVPKDVDMQKESEVPQVKPVVVEDKKFKAVIRAYESIQPITSFVSEQIKDDLDDYTQQEWIDAIDITRRAHQDVHKNIVKPYSYLLGILKSKKKNALGVKAKADEYARREIERTNQMRIEQERKVAELKADLEKKKVEGDDSTNQAA
jgi:hypothetical protein